MVNAFIIFYYTSRQRWKTLGPWDQMVCKILVARVKLWFQPTLFLSRIEFCCNFMLFWVRIIGEVTFIV